MQRNFRTQFWLQSGGLSLPDLKLGESIPLIPLARSDAIAATVPFIKHDTVIVTVSGT